jgi:hypothetical protein
MLPFRWGSETGVRIEPELLANQDFRYKSFQLKILGGLPCLASSVFKILRGTGGGG